MIIMNYKCKYKQNKKFIKVKSNKKKLSINVQSKIVYQGFYNKVH